MLTHVHGEAAKRSHRLAIGLAVGAFVVLVGCSRQAASNGDADPHLAMLTRLYADHLNANQGRIPHDEGQFKAFIRQHGAHRLKGVDPNQLDLLFVSTRDKKPLIIVFEAISDPRRQSPVVAYERSAVDGKRSVGYRSGTSELVDEATFAELVPAAGPASR